MARAKQPVSINGLEFDALIDEQVTLEAEVPEYPVEEGYSVSDAIIKKAKLLNMTLFVTNTPVTWRSRHGNSQTRVAEVCQKLKDLYMASEPVTVVTTDEIFANMAIESINFTKSTDVGYAREIPISFREIRITTSKTTTIPDEYGKSGTSEVAAGNANTAAGKTSSTTGGSINGDWRNAPSSIAFAFADYFSGGALGDAGANSNEPAVYNYGPVGVGPAVDTMMS